MTESQVIMYTTEDGEAELNVQLEKETVWLSLNKMADLFDRDKSVISRQINNIFKEKELSRKATVAKYAIVQNEGGREI